MLGLHDKEDAVRILRKRGEKKNIVGIVTVVEIDVEKIPKSDLAELEVARNNGDKDKANKIILKNGKVVTCPHGPKSVRKNYKDVTDRVDVYGGMSVIAWKLLLGWCVFAMGFAVIGQVLLILNNILERDIVHSFINGALLAYDIWLTSRVYRMAKHFWSERRPYVKIK